MKSYCLNCEQPFRGRSDKKFCSCQCRSDFNNRRYIKDGQVLRPINGILKHNYRILKQCFQKEHREVAVFDLISKGFNFKYFTHMQETEGGRVYFCYNLGYLPSENNYFALIPYPESAEDEGVLGPYHHSLWGAGRTDG